MDTIYKSKICMVRETDAQFFEQAFNETIERLAQFEPEPGTIQYDDGAWWCAITYTEKERVIESVSDIYAMEGIRYLCKNCPLHEPVTDGRVKYASCKYASLGRSHLEHGACEYFYKQLLQNKIEPVGV